MVLPNNSRLSGNMVNLAVVESIQKLAASGLHVGLQEIERLVLGKFRVSSYLYFYGVYFLHGITALLLYSKTILC